MSSSPTHAKLIPFLSWLGRSGRKLQTAVFSNNICFCLCYSGPVIYSDSDDSERGKLNSLCIILANLASESTSD